MMSGNNVDVALTEVKKKHMVKFCSDAGSEANHFEVNVSATERLVTRLRGTGRVADRPWSTHGVTMSGNGYLSLALAQS